MRLSFLLMDITFVPGFQSCSDRIQLSFGEYAKRNVAVSDSRVQHAHRFQVSLCLLAVIIAVVALVVGYQAIQNAKGLSRRKPRSDNEVVSSIQTLWRN